MNLQPLLFRLSTALNIDTMGKIPPGISSAWISNMSYAINHRILSIGFSGLLGAVFSVIKMTTSLWVFSFSTQLWQSFPFIFRRLIGLRRIFSPTLYDTYKSSEEEEKYWKEAARSQKILQQSDARYTGEGVPKRRGGSVPYVPPLVMYYTPALLPEYRDAPRKKKEVKKFYISGKNYCKWHWMVFPGEDHPTITEANKLRNLHSASELRMIDHIARMLPDDKVFSGGAHRARPWTPKYQKIWLTWFHSAQRTAERP